MINDSARICPECKASVPVDLHECWLCQARASRQQTVPTQLAEEKPAPKNEPDGDSPLVANLIARTNRSPDGSQNLRNFGTTLLAAASVLVLLVYGAACCGYLGLSNF